MFGLKRAGQLLIFFIMSKMKRTNINILRRSISVLAVSFIFFTGFSAYSEIDKELSGVIIGDRVNVRRTPQIQNDNILALYFRGNVVKILIKVEGEEFQKSKIWYQISDNLTPAGGFIHSSQIATGKKAETYLKNFSPEFHRGRFRKHLPELSFHSIMKHYRNFKSIKRENDFISNYETLNSLLPEIKNGVKEIFYKNNTGEYTDYYLEDMNWIIASIPGIMFAFVAEGTDVEVRIDLEAFMEKARRTSGKTDDVFINILLEAYGPHNDIHFSNWFVRTWDYGGYSTLGSGFHQSLLQKTDLYIEKNQFGNSEIKKIKLRIFHDIMRSQNFEGTKKQVVNELISILKFVKLDEKDSKSLNQRLLEIKNNRNLEYEFNCGDFSCDTGG